MADAAARAKLLQIQKAKAAAAAARVSHVAAKARTDAAAVNRDKLKLMPADAACRKSKVNCYC
jgi:hypothetical protein